jgi:nucleotide-binding universal stress UspA family protein
MGFQKILVAIDHSQQSPIVFDQALDLAKKENAKLMVFHAVNLQGQGEVAPMLGTGVGLDLAAGKTLQKMQQDSFQADIQEVKKEFKTYRQKVESEAIETEFRYDVGAPEVLICQMASEWNADLIVLGRRGRRGLTEILLGSVSSYVTHHATCSVLVVQGIEPEN